MKIPSRGDSRFWNEYKDCTDLNQLSTLFAESINGALESKSPKSARSHYEMVIEVYHQLMTLGLGPEEDGILTESIEEFVQDFPLIHCLNYASMYYDDIGEIKTIKEGLKNLEQAIEILENGIETISDPDGEIKHELEKILDRKKELETQKFTFDPKDALLTQQIQGTEFCIVELETTGFSPDEDDIVEIALIRTDVTGQILDEFHSVLRPGKPIMDSDSHSITEKDLVGAPSIADIAGNILKIMDNTVLVSYNAYFDIPFLNQSLFKTLNISTFYPYICAIYLRGLLGLKPARMKLKDACKQEKIRFKNDRITLDDAHAVHELFSIHIKKALETGHVTFSDFSKAEGNYKFMHSWGYPKPRFNFDEFSTNEPKTRSGRSKPPEKSGGSIVSKFHGAFNRFFAKKDGGEEEYLCCLVEALEDGILEVQEAEQLFDIARYYKLSKADIERINMHFYQSVYNDALADEVITDEEDNDLRVFAKILGIEDKLS